MKRRIRYLMVAVLALALLSGATAATAKAKKIKVRCDRGGSINAALMNDAEELIVEISGFCDENVVIRRDHVTLLGEDPATDGIRGVGPDHLDHAVVRIEDVYYVRLENLTITGGPRNGVLQYYGDRIELVNCRVTDNGTAGLATVLTFVDIRDTTFSGNQRSGIEAYMSSVIWCTRCAISGSGWAVRAMTGAEIDLTDSSLAGDNGVLSTGGGAFVGLNNTTVEATGTALYAWDIGEIAMWGGGSVRGHVRAESNSLVLLHDVVQHPLRASLETSNEFYLDSTLRLGGETSLLGEVHLTDFSKLVIGGDASLDGDLYCWSASDAYCEDPGNISGGVDGCGSCEKPTMP